MLWQGDCSHEGSTYMVIWPHLFISTLKRTGLDAGCSSNVWTPSFHTEPHVEFVPNSLHTPFSSFTSTLCGLSQSLMLEDIWAF